MHTLIFGANGQLGKDLRTIFSNAGTVTGVDLPEVDVADTDAVETLTQSEGPGLVVNAAAFTDVEAAEDHEPEAFRANEDGARIVARAAAAQGIPIVYYSTDYVFGGVKSTPYDVDDETAPIGVYARSKLAGEVATREENPKHFIVRTAWLYGPGGNNFVEKILAAAESRPSLKVVEDEVGAPTHTLDLAKASAALAETEAYGVYHAVNGGACSRYEFALAILEETGSKTPIEPCGFDAFPTKAERPLYSVLSTQVLEEATGFVMPQWRDALHEYIARR
ncbi:MAG: dTDP-4-dehydrorhamnose reductase [Candidatus Hydrogenedentes bacterium]|nr:dTDP-4-dehydrorhamnose reductase [Candidatus Hydrogenedentota bacterium]